MEQNAFLLVKNFKTLILVESTPGDKRNSPKTVFRKELSLMSIDRNSIEFQALEKPNLVTKLLIVIYS